VPLLLREADVAALLPMNAAIEIMEQALRAFSTGRVLQPVRLALSIEPHAGYLGLMPAHLRGGNGREALGAKAVTFYTGNTERHLPTHMAVILLWDNATGALVAIMDGRLITEFGVELPTLRSSGRHCCRPCLDWTERRPHIAGAVGAAITKRYFDLGWMERMKRSHAVIITPLGRRGFQETFGIDASEPGDRRKR